MLETLWSLPAPFTREWLPVWVFSSLAGLATAFIRINDIDTRLHHPYVAKPLIGTITGVATAVIVNGQTVPPPTSLAFWAFFGSMCATPIATGFLVFISDQNRQNELYKSAQDKFIPFGKKERSHDDV